MELPISSPRASSPSSRSRLGDLHARFNSIFSNGSSTYATNAPPPIEQHPALRNSSPRLGLRIFRGRNEARESPVDTALQPARQPPLSSYSVTDPAASPDTTSRPFTPSSLQTRVTEQLRSGQPGSNEVVSSPDAGTSRIRGRYVGAWVRRPRRKYGLLDRRGVSFKSALKNQYARRRLVSCGVAGIALAIVLAIYLALAVSNSAGGQEFHVLLILLIMVLTVFFCHSLIRLIMILLRGPREASNRIPSRAGPMGYAQPPQPIHIVLARDEEIGAENDEAMREKVTPPPPAYGLWRSSVRINPNLIYWQRAVEPMPKVGSANGSGESRPATAHRPPSYASDNGVDYVVEAQPRSIAPSAHSSRPSEGQMF